MALVSALFLWQCDHEGPTVGAPEFGSVVVAVSVPGGPEGKAGVPKAVVAKGLVRLSGIQIKKDIQQELPVQAGRMQGRIDGVPVGQVQVDLSLLDVGEVVLWQASTRVVVAPNATATASLTCKPVGDKPPDAAYSVKPETGKTSTEYEFGAQVSDLHDPTDALEVRWDFESDGRFDTDWSTTKIVRHTYAKPGTYRVALEARDAGGKIGTNSDHTVQVQNSPPVANAGQDITRNAGQTVQLDGKASADPDGTALTYSWRQTAGPTVIIQGEGTATPTFVATEGGTYSFALRVRDGELDSPEDEVLVTVIPASVDNRPPVADAGPDRTVDVGTTVQLDGTGSTDPDGNPLSYRWSAPAGTALSSTTIARPTVTPATPGTYQFTLVVNDGKVDSKPIGVTVTVVQPNRPPVANAGPDQTVDAGVTVQLDGTGSSDPDGNALTYRWSAPAGVALSSTTTPRPAFTPAMSGTYQFTLVVSDGKVDSSPDEVTVAVAPPLPANRPPVANAGPDQTVNIGVTVQLDGSASSDPDGNPLTFRWALSDGPQVGLSNAGTARPGFSPTQAGTYVWTLVVNDGKADSKADLVVITVQEMPAPGKTITEILPGGVSMEFVWIEPGTFLMGSPGSEPGRDADEGPQRQVTISKGFYLAKYEVTQEQWEVAIGSAPWSGQAHVQSNPRHPAVYISWDDVQEYLHRLNVATGDSLYRLPTEAEWEYACRAGTMTRWSFGNDESRLPEHAWYNANAWNVGEPYGHAIGAKLPNPWGLYDMHGNVWEWVQDWYGYYPSNAQTDPTGPVSGSGRVLRGGSVFIHAQNTRSADRNFTGPDDRVDNMGVRLVRLAEPVPANRPPKAHAGPDQTVNLGETVHLDGSGSSDPDGDPLTYRWSAPAGVALSSVTAARPTFAAASVGTYQFTLVVSDGKVDSSPDEVTVAVAQPLPANRPPMANAGPDQMVTVGETVQLDGSASRDPDGNALTYRWTPPAGVRLSDPAAVRPSFTADAEGTYRFGLVVNDGKVVSQPDEVVITATAPVVLPRIVFASDRAGLPAVYSVRLDGSDIANLTGGSSDDREPQASADGRRIVFTSYRDGVVDFYGNQLGELYAVNPDGSDLARLTSNEFADGEGAYSPDGLRIAFTTVRDLDAFGLPQAEVYVMNSDGTNPVNLTRNPAGDGQPAWSPDGRRIAFTTSRDLNGFGLPQMEVYVLNIDGSGLLRLTRSEADDAQPAWSPDGTRIAFVSTRDGNAEVYVMGADGSRQVDVSSNPANDWRPAWSPDGKQIAFVSDRSGTNEVYLMNADGSGVRKLLEGYGNADWPSWLKQ